MPAQTGKEKKMNRKCAKNSFGDACRRGSAVRILENYISKCKNDIKKSADENSVASKRLSSQSKRFPNVAGFCRYANIGISEFDALSKEFPDDFDRICLALEDEALNSGLPPALISAYMKKRLGYEKEFERPDTDTRPLQIRFEHDIFNDGE